MILIARRLTAEDIEAMNAKEFIEKVNEIIREHELYIEEDCDLWCMMTGFLFYKNEDSEKAFAHITGVCYTRDGSSLAGDFKGFLRALGESVIEEHPQEEV